MVMEQKNSYINIREHTLITYASREGGRIMTKRMILYGEGGRVRQLCVHTQFTLTHPSQSTFVVGVSQSEPLFLLSHSNWGGADSLAQN